MKHHIFTTLIIIFITSCNHSPRINIQDKVSIFPENKILKLSSIFNNYKIISLKGPLLTSINDISLKDSNLIIKGKSTTSSVHLFSADGIYKKYLLAEGRGTDEAFNIQSLKIDHGNIEILANFSTKLYIYSLSQNKIVNQYNLPKEITGSDDFIKFDSTRYIFYKSSKHCDTDEYKINIFNLNTLKIEQQYFPLTSNNDYISFSQMRNLYSIDNKILFHDVFSPGIYQIHNDSVSLYISFDKGKFNFPPTLLEKKYHSFDQFINICQKSSYIWGHIDICESNKHILSTYWYNKELFLNVIGKQTMASNSYTHIYDDLITDETYSIGEGLNNTAAMNNIQFFILEPYKFKEILDKKKESGIYENYQKQYSIPCRIAEQLSEDDNTLLILFYE